MSDELDLGAATEAFGVRQFIGKVNHAMKNTFTPGIWVHGEIESWSNRTQHAYFQLVERDEKGTATIHVSLFANNLRRLQPLLRQRQLLRQQQPQWPRIQQPQLLRQQRLFPE